MNIEGFPAVGRDHPPDRKRALAIVFVPCDPVGLREGREHVEVPVAVQVRRADGKGIPGVGLDGAACGKSTIAVILVPAHRVVQM